MKEYRDGNESTIDSLRSQMDADARFRRAIGGYHPKDVYSYVVNVKRIFAQQVTASKQEQEHLIAQLETAKSEIQARNFAVTRLKGLLAEREQQIKTARARIDSLFQFVKKQHEAEREELERLRLQVQDSGVPERIQALQQETKHLRAAAAQVLELVEGWKAERERLLDENGRLRREAEYLRTYAARSAPKEDEYGFAAAQSAYHAEADFQPEPQRADTGAANHKAAAQPEHAEWDGFLHMIDQLAVTIAEVVRLAGEQRPGAQPQREAPQEPQPQRPLPPFMQILRPEGANSDSAFTRK